MRIFNFAAVLLGLLIVPLQSHAEDVKIENNIIFGDTLMGDLFQELIPIDPGPVYHYEFIVDREAEIVWQARAEVLVLGSMEFTMLKSSMRRAAEKAEEGGRIQLAEEIKRMLPVTPRPLPRLFADPGDFTLARPSRLQVHPGTEVEVINRDWLLAKSNFAYLESYQESDQARKNALQSCGRLLRRASLFYVRFGHSKAEACMLNQLFCRLHSGTPCWTECEIVAAERIRDTACARHGEYLTSWFPGLLPSLQQWSAKKAVQLGGTHDLDVEACTNWLAEVKPILIEECGEEYVQEIYSKPRLRTYLWMLVARSMRCSSLLYWGNAQELSSSAWIANLNANRADVSENMVALESHLNSMAIECCGPVRIDGKAIVVEETVEAVPVPVPVPQAEVIVPSGGCLPCQGKDVRRWVPPCGRRLP